VKDASGVLTTSTYDLANQLVTSQDANGATTYTYDLAGNLHIVEHATGQRTTTTWDDQNRQTGVLFPDGSAVTNTSRFDGLRYSKQEPQATTKFLWDVNKYLAETNAADEIQAVYTNEPQPYGQCAGCVNKQVVTTLGSWPGGPQSNIFDPDPINVQRGGGLMVTLPGFASEAKMLKCCRQKGTSGGLDIAIVNTAPSGEGIPIISIPPNPSR
jgi:YD repeat-containing protein